MPTNVSRPSIPTEIVAARRRDRVRMVRLYISAIVLVVVLGFGALVVFGLPLQQSIEANGHLSTAVGDYARDDLAAADREIRQAISIKGDDYDARFDLGIVLLKEGHYDAALAQFRQAEGIKKLPTPFLYAGIAALAMHQPDLARAEASGGLALVGQDPDMDAVLAMADQQLGRSADAARAYASARASGYQAQTVRGWIAQASLAQD